METSFLEHTWETEPFLIVNSWWSPSEEELLEPLEDYPEEEFITEHFESFICLN